MSSIFAAALCLDALGTLPANAAGSTTDKSALRATPPLTINLMASSPEPALGQSVTLTATTNRRVGRGEAIEIYWSGMTILGGCERTDTCSVTVKQDRKTPFPGDVTFVAYVAVYTDVDEYVEAQSNEVKVSWPITEFPTGIMVHDGCGPFPGPPGITAGPDGNLWFTTPHRVAKMTTAGNVAPPYPVTSCYADLHEITVGPDRNLWFTEFQCDKLGKKTLDDTFPAEFTIPGADPHCLVGNVQPEEITAGPDGNLWFTAYKANKVGKMTPNTPPIFSWTDLPEAHPWGIVAGPGGALWVTEPNADKVVRIFVDGTIRGEPIPLPQKSLPWGIAVGPDGNVWVIEQGLNKVAKITPDGLFSAQVDIPTPDAGAWAITTGPDGNLWFTESKANQVARMTPAGIVTEFPAPSAVPSLLEGITAGPKGITAGPDGNLWFTEFYTNKVARVRLVP